MKGEPKLSIIIPVYNAEKYLERCMDSIYAQTFNDYEIILVNDGSKDKSADVCRSYCEKDERVQFIDKENGGAGSARNAGIEVARGEYLAFPDVDDWIETTMYEELLQLSQGGKYDLVVSGVNYYQHSLNSNIRYSRTTAGPSLSCSSQTECRNKVMDFFPTTIIFDSPCNKLYKRQIVSDYNLRFSSLRRCQDAMFNLDFYDCITSVVSTDKAYYNYLENTVQDVQRKFPQNYIDINIFYYTHLKEIMSKWGMYQQEIKQHYDSSFVLSVYETIEMFENPQWKFNKREQKEYIHNIMHREIIQKNLLEANVRVDIREKYNILLNKDIRTFMKKYKTNKLKNVIRKNRWIMKCYKTIFERKKTL